MRLVNLATVLETEKLLDSEVVSSIKPVKDEFVVEKYEMSKNFSNSSLKDQIKSKILKR